MQSRANDAALKKRISHTEAHSRKGDAGAILVIGGSEFYTGAPFFASMAALVTGSELVYIFSEPAAILPLKTLLPEAIVCQTECHEWILCRVTACVVGTGLGRPSIQTCEVIRQVLMLLDGRGIPIVVDGDAIGLCRELGIHELRTAVLTPNANEKRHIEKMEHRFFYIEKGPQDVVVGNGERVVVDAEGCPKRVGGQGDILAGTVASLLSRLPLDGGDVVGTLALACRLVRGAANMSYRQHWNSVITRNILDSLGECFALEVNSAEQQ